MRFFRVLQVVNNTLVTAIQFPGRRVDAIALFSHSKGDNRNLWLAELFNNGIQSIEFCIQAFVNRADNNRLITFTTFFQYGIQMVLCTQRTH